MSTNRFVSVLYRGLVVMLVFGFASMLVVRAQGNPQNNNRTASSQSTPSALSPGAHPLGTYGGSSFDNINLFNGNVSFRIPLAGYSGRAGMSTGLALSYNSKIWHTDEIPDSQNPQNPGYLPNDDTWDGQPRITAGWMLTPGILTARQTAWNDPDGTAPGVPCLQGTYYNRTLTTITFIAPDGTEYDFADALTGGQPAVVAANACDPGFNRGRKFHSTDGTAALFISDTDILDFNNPTTMPGVNVYPAFGTIFLRDGTRYRVENGLVKKITDRNGNIIRYEYDGFGLVTKVIDTLGRSIIIEYFPIPINAQNERTLATVTQVGFGGASKIFVIQGNRLANVLKSGQTQPKSVLFPPPFAPDANTEPHNPYVVSKIWLPRENPQQAGFEWEFKYNNYGEVVSVKMPSQGVIEYDMTTGPGLFEPFGSLQKQIFRRVLERRSYTAPGTTETLRTTYSDPLLPFPNGNAVVTETHIDPQRGTLTASRHKFYNNAGAGYAVLAGKGAGYRPWQEGKELETVEFDMGGTTQLRTTTNVWEQRAPVPWTTNQDTAPQNDPRLAETSVKWNQTNQTARKTFNHDRFNNVTREKAFDFNGQLLQQVDRTYVDGDYTNDDLNPRPVHIVSLVETESVGKGGTPETTTRYQYDQSPLTGRTFGDPNTHDSATYSTSFTLRGNVTSATAGDGTPAQATVTTEYDIAGNAVRVTGPLPDQIVESEYDSTHFAYRLETRQNVGGRLLKTTRTVDAQSGLVTSETGYNPGETTTYTYNDFLDRVTRVQRPTGYGDTRYVYSPPGVEPWMQVETQISGSTYVRMTTEFDGLLRAKKVFRNDPRDFNGVSSETEYDGLGRVVKVFNAHRTAPASTDGYTTTVYDGLSRPNELTTFDRNGNPTGTVDSQYDGNAVTVKDQAENPRKSVTDAIGRLTSVFESNGVSTVVDVETRYEYDARGNLLFVKAIEGLSTVRQQRSFTYDALSRLASATSPESGTMTYQYDQASNLTRRQDARNTVTLYTYDEMNRPLTKTYQVAGTTAATPNVRYYYDGATPEGIPGFNAGAALGRMNAVETDALGSQRETGCYYAYQTGGRLERMVELVDGKQFASRATYNEASLPLTLEYPSLATVRMAYNPVGQAERIERQKGSTTRTLSNNLLYTAPGGLEQQQYGNNLFHKTTYNSRQQVETITLGTGTVGTAAEDRLKLAYGYGTTANNGNVLNIALTPGAGAPTFTQNFGYDRLNRLTSATETVNSTQSWTQGYTYDRFGNRFQVTGLGAHNINISEQTNRIDQSGYDYDLAGNLRQEPGGKSYTYDAENRIVTATVGGAVSRYEYDGEGKRLKKITPAETVRFVYGANGELMAEYHGETVVETQPTKEYVYGASGLLCEIELACNGRAAYKYVTPDHLGTPRVVTNHNGGILSRHDYLPFGEDIAPTLGNRTAIAGYAQPDRIRKKFTGYERDDETGLDFAQARYYSSQYGRFTSVDPIIISKKRLSDPQSICLYSYARNNPLRYIDLTGKYFVGANGKRVNFTLNDNGKIVLGKNASAALVQIAKQINKAGSETAIAQFAASATNETKNHFKIVKKEVDNGLLGLHQAHDKNGKALTWEAGTGGTGKFDGQPAYIKDKTGNMVYKEATITIFEGNFTKSELENQQKATGDLSLTKDEAVVKTFSHEVDHNTNQEAINAIRDRQEGKQNDFDVEAPAEKAEEQVHQEIINNRPEKK